MSKLDELYERLGVRKGISAAGSTTMYGGSKLRSEVTEIMIEASTVMLDMDELNKAAGKMIGELTGAESGLVTSGSAGGLLLQALEWQQTRGSRSGRVAWQFISDLAGKHDLNMADKII